MERRVLFDLRHLFADLPGCETLARNVVFILSESSLAHSHARALAAPIRNLKRDETTSATPDTISRFLLVFPALRSFAQVSKLCQGKNQGKPPRGGTTETVFSPTRCRFLTTNLLPPVFTTTCSLSVAS